MNLEKSQIKYLLVLALLALALPLAAWLASRPQLIQKRAACAVNLRLEPASGSHAINNAFSVNLQIEAGTAAVAGADVNLSFDASKLKINSIAWVSDLNTEIIKTINNTNGTARISAVKMSAGGVAGTFNFATIVFEGLAVTSTPVAVALGNAEVTATGEGVACGIGTKTNGSYTITDTTAPTNTPIPTGGPSGSCTTTPPTFSGPVTSLGTTTVAWTISNAASPNLTYQDGLKPAEGEKAWVNPAGASGSKVFSWNVTGGQVEGTTRTFTFRVKDGSTPLGTCAFVLTKTAGVAPTPTGGAAVGLNLKFRINGIDSPRTAETTSQIQQFKVTLVGPTGITKTYTTSAIRIGDGGVVEIDPNIIDFINAHPTLTSVPTKLFIKWTKSLQKKYEGITITRAGGDIDLTTRGPRYYLEPGDLPIGAAGVQDGVVNALDAVYLTGCFATPEEATCLAKADLNLDGVINTMDMELMNGTVYSRWDDEVE